MVQGKYLSGDVDLSQAYELREEVFQRELGIPREIERDGYDGLCVHAVAYQGQEPVATGRILYEDGIFRISRVAVKAEKRSQGYGDFVVRLLINRARQAGADEIYASTLTGGKRMFEAIGFEVCGDAYESGGLTYFPMWLKKEKLNKCCDCS